MPDSLRQVAAKAFKSVVDIEEGGPEKLKLFFLDLDLHCAFLFALLKKFEIGLEKCQADLAWCLIDVIKTISNELPIARVVANLRYFVEEEIKLVHYA